VGMLKLIFHTETMEELGVHCFGDGGSEIVHVGQTVMASRDLNDVRFFTRTTFNYPTMAEAYRDAAYNRINRLTYSVGLGVWGMGSGKRKNTPCAPRYMLCPRSNALRTQKRLF